MFVFIFGILNCRHFENILLKSLFTSNPFHLANLIKKVNKRQCTFYTVQKPQFFNPTKQSTARCLATHIYNPCSLDPASAATTNPARCYRERCSVHWGNRNKETGTYGFSPFSSTPAIIKTAAAATAAAKNKTDGA